MFIIHAPNAEPSFVNGMWRVTIEGIEFCSQTELGLVDAVRNLHQVSVIDTIPFESKEEVEKQQKLELSEGFRIHIRKHTLRIKQESEAQGIKDRQARAERDRKRLAEESRIAAKSEYEYSIAVDRVKTSTNLSTKQQYLPLVRVLAARGNPEAIELIKKINDTIRISENRGYVRVQSKWYNLEQSAKALTSTLDKEHFEDVTHYEITEFVDDIILRNALIQLLAERFTF